MVRGQQPDGSASPGSPAAAKAGVNVRQRNLGALVQLLHVAGPTSRARLTQLTGLNRSTIGGLVGELSELGLVAAKGFEVTAGPGRPSPLVEPRPDGAAALVVELTVDCLASAVVGFGGEILAERRLIRPRRSLEPEEAIEEVARQIGSMRRSWERVPLVGIGVAVAGLTNRLTGTVDFGPNLGWRDVPLGELLLEALVEVGVPAGTGIELANEADLGALAEARRGAGRGVNDLVYVSGEVGIGVGVISGGRPLLGAAGYSAEAGHMLVNPEGAICGCGARGCWETEAGELALLRRAGIEPTLVGGEAIGAVLERAADDDPVAIAAIEETGRWLGLGFASLVNLFNPRLVVLGGLYHRLFQPLEAFIREAFRSQALRVSADMVELLVSELGDEALVVGASELVFDQLFEDPVGVVSGRAHV
jgi:predicted NBD/HSP70 family sugar kinase